MSNLKKIDSKTVRKAASVDGWYNIITGLGTKKDKTTFQEIQWDKTDRVTAESLFAADEMGGKIASIIPQDGTREGVSWNMDRNTDQELVLKFINREFKRLKVWPELAFGWTMARVHGGALVFLNVDDGLPLARPLRIERIRSLKSLKVFDRWDFQVREFDIIKDLSNPNYGTPEIYHYQPTNGLGGGDSFIPIHYTRFIRFDGVRLPWNLYKINGYWHDSIYSRLGHALRNYALDHDNSSRIINSFNQPVYRMEGLTAALDQDQDELIYKKLKTVNLMRSIINAIALDKEDEFQNVSTNVSGGRELVDLAIQRLVAGSDIPHTRLLGNSPSGLGATGMAELINYYDSVASFQEVVLREPIEVLKDLIFQQNDVPVEKPEDLDFQFNPLFQQDEKTEAESREKQARTDKTYMDSGVLTPEEVANSRFGTGKYSYETVLEKGIERSKTPVDLSQNGQNQPNMGENPNDDDLEGL